MLTWSFNVSNQDGQFNNSFAFALASSHSDPFDIVAHGYAFRGGGMVGNRITIQRFSSGLGRVGNVVVDVPDGLGVLPQKGSFRITFDPKTKIWSLYGTTGTSYTDPETVGTLLGSGTDNTHINEALPFISLNGQVTGASFFDNVRVTLAREVNRVPLVRTDEVLFTGEPALTIYPLANDEDPEGEPLQIDSVSAAQFGTIEIVPGASDQQDFLRYTPGPAAMENGETLTYTASDPEGGVASGQIIIAPVTDSAGPPIHLFLLPGEAPIVSLIEGLPEPGPWRISRIAPPAIGKLDNGPDDDLAGLGQIRYTPAEGAIQNDHFSVSLINAAGIRLERQVTVQAPQKGLFEGLYVHNKSRRAMEGRLQVQLSRTRQFSALIQLRGRTERLKGELDATGSFRAPNEISVQIRKDDGRLSVRGFIPGELGERYVGNETEATHASDPLPPQPTGISLVSDINEGTAPANGWHADARRVIYSTANDLAGSYTFVLPSATQPDPSTGVELPLRGHGWGLLRVSSTGAVTLAGATGDGALWSGGGRLRQDRTLLLYASIPKRKDNLPGALAGLLLFRQIANTSDGDGVLNWLPSFRLNKANRVSQIATRQPILVSRYTEPESGGLPLSATTATEKEPDNASFFFSRVNSSPGALPMPMIRVAPVTLESKAFAATRSSDGFGIEGDISQEHGLMCGSFIDPTSDTKRSFAGVVFQKTNRAFGSLTDEHSEGAVSLWIPAEKP